MKKITYLELLESINDGVQPKLIKFDGNEYFYDGNECSYIRKVGISKDIICKFDDSELTIRKGIEILEEE